MSNEARYIRGSLGAALPMNRPDTRARLAHERGGEGFARAPVVCERTAQTSVAFDGAGKVLFASEPLEQLLGWTEGELRGQQLGVLFPEPLRYAFGAGALATALPALLERPLAVRLLSRDGAQLVREMTVSPLPDPADGYLATIGELPARVALEQQLAISRLMRAATRAASVFSSRLDLPQVLETVVRTLVDDFGAARAGIWLVEDEAARLRLGAAAWPPEDTPPPPELALEASHPLAEVARSRVPCLRRATGGGRRGCWLLGEESVALLPLATGATLHGVLACAFVRPLEDQLVEVLSAFAAMASASLNDLNLFAREQAARTAAEAAGRRLAAESEAAAARARELAEANDTLKRQRDALEQAKRGLSVQYAILQALAQTDRIEGAAPLLLEAIGTNMGWDVGALWMADERVGEIRAVHVWKAPTCDAPTFVERTQRTTYDLGEGLVGRVFQTGEPAWLERVDAAPFKRARLAATEGLAGGIWFPIRHGNAVFGVIEFFRREARAPDDEALQTLFTLGNQIGLFIERDRARRAAQAGEERLATTLRSIGEAVITTDIEGSVDFMNPEAEALTGWTFAEARGRPLGEVFHVVHADTREPVDDPLERVIREGPVLGLARHSLLLARDGSEAAIDDSAAPIRNRAGELLGVVLVFRNVTERKRADERKRFVTESSARLACSLDYQATLSNVARLAVEGLADWCVVELLDGDSIEAIAVAHADPGQSAVAEQMRRRYPPDPHAAQGVGKVLHDGEPLLYPEMTDAELAATAHDPEHFQMLQRLGLRSMMIVPLTARGRTFGAVLFASARPSRRYGAEDLSTALELARRAGLAIDNARLYREAQEAVRVRDEFLSIASHELKTPLTSLKLQVQSLLRQGAADLEALPPKKLQAKLQCADQQVARLGKLVNDLLDVSRISGDALTLELQEVDLAAVVRSVVESHAERLERAGCHVDLWAPAELLGRWDRLRLEQAISNLLSNALKYGTGKPIEIAVGREGDLAVLSITDHGIGIAREDLARIFARFERAVSAHHYGGLGVGLYIVQRVLEAMGGTIEVASEPGQHTTFRLKLPIAGPKAISKIGSAQSDEPQA